jgi:histidyl-tRNA synthetase
MLSVSAILDDQLAALAVFSDVAAAFWCEASNADVTVFNLIDSGDGHSSKEEVSVATVMRILLNGSKLVGKQNVPSIIKIPEVHGLFRETVKRLHSTIRVGSRELALCNVLLPLADALMKLGQFSFVRAQSNL